MNIRINIYQIMFIKFNMLQNVMCSECRDLTRYSGISWDNRIIFGLFASEGYPGTPAKVLALVATTMDFSSVPAHRYIRCRAIDRSASTSFVSVSSWVIARGLCERDPFDVHAVALINAARLGRVCVFSNVIRVYRTNHRCSREWMF